MDYNLNRERIAIVRRISRGGKGSNAKPVLYRHFWQ